MISKRKWIDCILFVALLFFFGNVDAASFPSFSCPTTFQTVKVGDTMAAVQAACGAPTSTGTRNDAVVTPITSTQWTYTLGLFSLKGVSFVLPTLVVIFDDDKKVSQITRSDSPVSAGYCAVNGLINVGDPMSTVLLACGQPNFISTRQQANTTTKTVTQWNYNFGPYKPQIIFDFENGQLTQINSGQTGN